MFNPGVPFYSQIPHSLRRYFAGLFLSVSAKGSGNTFIFRRDHQISQSIMIVDSGEYCLYPFYVLIQLIESQSINANRGSGES